MSDPLSLERLGTLALPPVEQAAEMAVVPLVELLAVKLAVQLAVKLAVHLAVQLAAELALAPLAAVMAAELAVKLVAELAAQLASQLVAGLVALRRAGESSRERTKPSVLFENLHRLRLQLRRAFAHQVASAKASSPLAVPGC
jgi:hypothetical protein